MACLECILRGWELYRKWESNRNRTRALFENGPLVPFSQGVSFWMHFAEKWPCLASFYFTSSAMCLSFCLILAGMDGNDALKYTSHGVWNTFLNMCIWGWSHVECRLPFHPLFAEPCCLGVHSNPFLFTFQLLFRSFSVNFAPRNLVFWLSHLLECLIGKGGTKNMGISKRRERGKQKGTKQGYCEQPK